MRKLRLGDIVRYTGNPKDTEGLYALVFRVFYSTAILFGGAQAVWFGEKEHCLKYGVDYKKYSISGIQYSKNNSDCKIVSKIPKRIKKRVGEALQYVVKRESEYYDSNKFTNLDMVEVLAKFKKLL
jgi:hypothetical protein